MEDIEQLLKKYADRYETEDFLPADPSWFMHQVKGINNQETLAFVASCLSYGNRKQFFPKIQYILDSSGGEYDVHFLIGISGYAERLRLNRRICAGNGNNRTSGR